DVFSRNMRDLGTPVYGRALFRSILHQFAGDAELCVVRAGERAVAAGVGLRGHGGKGVPSGRFPEEVNRTNANTRLHCDILQGAVERGQSVSASGRWTPECGPFHFKQQGGARPEPAEWQYYRRRGQVSDARPDNPCFKRLIRVWQKLPISLTRLLGPAIVR